MPTFKTILRGALRRSKMIKTLLTLLAIYVALSLLIYVLAPNLIHYPPRAGYKYAPDVLLITTKNGAKIAARYLPNLKARYTILVSHGNAEDIGYMLPFLQAMHHHGFAVFAYDYRGYGLSTGTPTERHCYEDVSAAYEYLTHALKVPPARIITYGRSIGAAMALELALHKPVAGVIMQSPFVSAYRVATRFPLFLFDQYRNLAKIKRLARPLFIIHGTHDTIVPLWHSVKLYNAATVAPEKRYFWIEGAGHNNTLEVAGEKYWQMLDDFINELPKLKN